MNANPLTGHTIAIPETRELDLFAQMLESRGAATVRCPLVAILDAPDQGPIIEWLQQLAAGRFHDLIFLTGEGLRRLLKAADRNGIAAAVIAALRKTRKITRGPKPARALRDIGLRHDLAAEPPTTDGVIATLSKLDLKGRRLGVQLYGTEPNLKLIDFIRGAGAEPCPVAPYVYASEADDQKVKAFIRQLSQGEFDVIAFTSAQQITRLYNVAKTGGLEEALNQGWSRTKVAAVGPIVADTLKTRGVRVDMMPGESYFMKPLVNAIVAALAA
ncbi:MAG: uroporphyrinogen-III synthase [Gammaproteobacteria bacterium]